ncbi:hypothetical protein CLOAM1363 [Candidatus Cloacimonas acidaminovorans str. Evry]|uniref:Uncharacterized protein n=1 Tax=Cloacimonas acidaminovorans (strain Evry) TaxID=459349 RepID=B0VJ16_CLOAI|nr:hypothetical protein CLOAM1363 [Candidatus Cloacimonas acidaminovorans str. Evry]
MNNYILYNVLYCDTNKNNLIILYLLLNFIYKNNRVKSVPGC